jgi:hypothetical protein
LKRQSREFFFNSHINAWVRVQIGFLPQTVLPKVSIGDVMTEFIFNVIMVTKSVCLSHKTYARDSRNLVILNKNDQPIVAQICLYEHVRLPSGGPFHSVPHKRRAKLVYVLSRI